MLPLGAGQQQRQHPYHDHQFDGEHQSIEVIHLFGADAHHAAKQQGEGQAACSWLTVVPASASACANRLLPPLM